MIHRRLLSVVATCLGALLLAPAAFADDDTTPTLGVDSASPTSPSSSDTNPSQTAETPDASPLERVSAYVQPSVIYLGMEWAGYVKDTAHHQYLKNSKPFIVDTQCTGYVVNPDGYIATAGHCVDPHGDIIDIIRRQAAGWAIDHEYYADNTLTVEDILAFGDFRVEGLKTVNKGPDRDVTVAYEVSEGTTSSAQTDKARVIDFEPFDKGDGALLKVETNNLSAIELGQSDALEVGTEIVSIGYPASVDLVTDASLEPSFKDGTVSSTKTIQDGLLTVYEISAAVSGGMSGGPTVNLDGQVVGFNSFGIDSSIESQQFNFVRPAEIIKELMAGAGVDNTVGATGETYRRGLDAYYAGDKTAAVDALQTVVRDQPTNQLAHDFLTKAQQLPDPPEVAPTTTAAPDTAADSGTGFSLLPWLIVGGVLLLLLLLGAALALRRRGRSAPAPAPQYAGAPSVGAGGPFPSQQAWGTPSPYPPPGSAASTGPVPPGATAAPPGPFVPPQQQQAPPQPTQSQSQSPPQFPPTAPGGPVPPAGGPVRPTPAADQPAGRVIYCPTCGTPAAPGARFCSSCGSSLG